MLIWTVVLLAIVEGGIAVLLSRYVSVTRPESLVAIIGGQVLLMAGITFFMSGWWRADVRCAASCKLQTSEPSYDGTLASDCGQGWDDARVVVRQGSENSRGPTVAFISGGAWHRGTPDSWLYAGNIVGHLSTQYEGVVSASIGYRRCKTPPCTLYVGYPLYVIAGLSPSAALVASVLIPTQLALWPAVLAALGMVALLYLWLFGFHPTGLILTLT